VQRCYLDSPDELQAFAVGISYMLKGTFQSQSTIESSTFLQIPQLGQAAPEDFVTYLMVTAEVGMPDAV